MLEEFRTNAEPTQYSARATEWSLSRQISYDDHFDDDDLENDFDEDDYADRYGDEDDYSELEDDEEFYDDFGEEEEEDWL